MKNFLLFFILILILNVPASANNSTTYATQCSGKWVLIDDSGWAVRNEEGIILPLSYDTVVLGCAKAPIKLKPKLSGASVEVTCKPSLQEFGMPSITKIIIICR